MSGRRSKFTRGQGAFVRALRLSRGCCPTHGIPLVQSGITMVGEQVVDCPRGKCDFKDQTVKRGSKLERGLNVLPEDRA